MRVADKTFSIVTGLFQVVLVILFAFCIDYGEFNSSSSTPTESNSATYYYSFFQDVHVMVFIGFGFLMTFLKKYSYGAVGYNMFISALVIQWATLMGGWIHNAFSLGDGTSMIKIDLKTMINSDFAAAAVLITFGAVLGKVSRLQLVIIAILEIIFYYLNESIIISYVEITDAGGSIYIHMFGAYFGLAVARMIYDENVGKDNEKEGSVYHSDVFAMIGTIFLWMFWPSFNGGMLGPGSQQHRALINTYFSLAACCVTVFVVSPLVDRRRRLDMVHVQNATLAGGVAVGTCADMVIGPWGAMLIGMSAGVLSTLGYAYVTPFLMSKLKIHDTCGVNNLHGMPAILAAVAGAIAATAATVDTYGKDLFSMWPARMPSVNDNVFNETMAKNMTLDGNMLGRNALTQGGMQVVAMVITLAISIGSGLLTGGVIRLLDTPTPSQLYDDSQYWILPQDDDQAAHDGNEESEPFQNKSMNIESV